MMRNDFLWKAGNAVRALVGLSPRPRRCCRDGRNLGPVERVNETLTFRRCAVCQSRHFEMTADPGRMGLRLAQAP